MRSLFVLRCAARVRTQARRYTTAPSFTYSLASSFHGKSSKKSTTAFKKNSAIAHWRDSILKSSSWNVDAGEDFCFSERLGQELAIGCCDGVGGLAESGVE